MNNFTKAIVAAAVITATTLSAVTPAQAKDTKPPVATCKEGATKTVGGIKYTCLGGVWLPTYDMDPIVITGLKFFLFK